jgi:hypothetical protein
MIRFVNADAVVFILDSIGYLRKKSLVFLCPQRIMRGESPLKMNEGKQIDADLFPNQD